MINCIYLHIPFCKKKCKYCAFCSFPLLNKKDEYLKSLTKEIKHFYPGNKIKTLYFGGGTPSLLESGDVEKILNLFGFDSSTEVTLEANPFELSLEKLKAFNALGINRLSLGVQSFDDGLLRSIGRPHNKKDIFKATDNIRKAGFNNLSIDLMYGLEGQNKKIWSDTLYQALKLDPEHISLYGLKIEQGTYYSKNPPKNLPDNDLQAEMYELAIEVLSEKYLRYEFSNFAKNENFYSKHNLCYWNRENYLGFGLSASGFIDNKRYVNTFNYKNYILNPLKKTFEPLTKEAQIEEEIFLGLRKEKGINFGLINEKYSIDVYELYKKQFDKFLKDGFLIKTEKGVKFSLKGVLVSNEILCEFIDA